MQGKVRRLSLGPNERQRILKKGYNDWRAGRVQDRTGLIKCIGDSRAAHLAATYIDSDYPSELVEYIKAQEAIVAAARRQRMPCNQLIPKPA